MLVTKVKKGDRLIISCGNHTIVLTADRPVNLSWEGEDPTHPFKFKKEKEEVVFRT